MGKRRGHNEGSIYQIKDGRYAAALSLGDGKRKYFYAQTRREVKEKLDTARYELRQGTLATGRQQKLGDYLVAWMETVHFYAVSRGSYETGYHLLKKHILPDLGHIQVHKLTSQQVQAFYASKLQEGLSPKYVIGMHALLHTALDMAVTWNLVGKNVCDFVQRPKVERREMKSLTPAQARHFIDAAKQHRLEVLITVALATGMRKGELLGLRYEDIDFERGTISIQRTVRRIKGMGFLTSEPKKKSSRIITLPAFALDALKRHRESLPERRAKSRTPWQESGYVFCNSVGACQDSGSLDYMFQRLLKGAGLPHMRFHDLRHSAASLLLSMGIHPKVVQEWLGHSNISMTMDTYSHVLPTMQEEAMKQLNELFKKE